MKYPLATAAANTDELEQVNEGIWVTEQAIEGIEATLAQNAEVIGTQATQLEDRALAHQQEVEGISAQLEAANATITERDAAIEAANATIADRDAQIVALNERVAALEAGPAGKFSESAKEKDDVGASANRHLTSVDAEADQLRAMRNKK